MEIKVNYLDNLRIEALFDDFKVIADQPIRYKGDGSAPGPFDYYLASSALCAAYFVKVYCNARDISTDNIRLSQNNIVDPENRHKQTFKIQVELPESLSDKDRQGILRSIERCTVKKSIQEGPEFIIEAVTNLEEDAQAMLMAPADANTQTTILGKDLPLEQTIANMSAVNIVAPSLLVQAGHAALSESKGAIVNIGTAAAQNAVPMIAHYAATKSALEHLTKSWAIELAGDGIRVNAIAPGPVKSGALTGMMGLPDEIAQQIETQEAAQVPLGRRGVTSDIVPWILRLGSSDNAWLTGQVLTVDGGWSLRS